MNYYNELDEKKAAWLKALIKEGLIPDGKVDTRSITEVKAEELSGYRQCHFFAGIGGWPLALQLAGVDPARPLFTGSPPCQSFSCAGKRKGFEDPRGKMWEHFFGLVRECRPELVMGEQVAQAITHGWLCRVSDDLEGEGYTVRSVVLGAFSVGAPQKRSRLYWGGRIPMGVTEGIGLQVSREKQGCPPEPSGGDDSAMGNSESYNKSRDTVTSMHRERFTVGRSGSIDNSVADTEHDGHSSATGKLSGLEQCEEPVRPVGYSVPFDSTVAIPCRDGKRRRIPAQAESVFLRMADGLPGWMDESFAELGFPLAGKVKNGNIGLKGFGDAIVPQVAEKFITAFLQEE